MELAINKKVSCKYTTDVKFFIKKLEERIEIDFNFFYLCLLKLIEYSYNFSLEFNNFKKLETLVLFYFDQKFKNEDEMKKQNILNKFENYYNNIKTINLRRQYRYSNSSSRRRQLEEDDERRRQWEEEEEQEELEREEKRRQEEEEEELERE